MSSGLLEVAGRLILWAALLGAVASIARRLLRSPLAGASHLVWDGAAGLAALMAALIALGQVPGAYSRVALIGATCALAVAAIVLRVRSRASITVAEAPMGLPLLTLSGVAAVGLVWDRVPPVFFDSLSYHFAQPGLWLVEGRLAPVSWSLHSWFPPGMSALYGLGMAWGGDAAASDANLLCGLLLLGMIFDLAQRLWNRTAAWAALGLAATAPIFVHALGIPGADLGHGLMGFGSVASWLLWRKTADASWARRAALLAAGAVLTKYLGLIVPLALGAVLFGALPPAGADRSASASIRRAVTFALPALLLFVPWAWANWRATGNPVAPVLASLLPTVGLADGALDAFIADARGGLPSLTDAKQLWRTLLAGDPASAGMYPTPAWGFAPLLLVAGLWPWWRRERSVLPLLILAGVTFAAWFLTYRWERFLVATTALAAVALGGAIAAAWPAGRLPRAVVLVGALLALASSSLAVRSVMGFSGGAGVALGREEPNEFVERAFPARALVRKASASLPRGSRLLLVGDVRHHGLGLPRAAPAVFNSHPLGAALEDLDDPGAVSERLRAERFSHLLVDIGWVGRSAERYPSLGFVRARPERLNAYLVALGRPLAEERGVFLFAIPEPGR